MKSNAVRVHVRGVTLVSRTAAGDRSDLICDLAELLGGKVIPIIKMITCPSRLS